MLAMHRVTGAPDPPRAGYRKIKEGDFKPKGPNDMKSVYRALLFALCAVSILFPSAGWAQTAGNKVSASPNGSTREKNLQAYVDLVRSNVRQQKAEMMGSVMLLSAGDATKFWPIYSDYDAQLTKLNDQRVANIKEYARTYNQMTDEKANELIEAAMTYQKQRAELLSKTYERLKSAVGAITAARFVQVEHQLLLLIDLQIASELPVVTQGS